MKTLHKLKKNNKLFNDFYVFDTETKGLRAKQDAFIFGVVYGYNYTKVIYSVTEFQKEFESERYKKKKVFAHNLEYDGNVIYDNIYDIDPKAIFNGKLICFTNGNCLFADSFNIYPTSVKVIGELLGLKKLDIEKQYTTGTKEIKGVSKKMIEYCIRDCEIIYKALLYMFNKCDDLKITIASLSLSMFRRNYQSDDIKYNNYLQDPFFKSYFGGRVEAFFIGECKAFVYDVNSMYPYSMVNCIFPNPQYLKISYNVSIDVFINKYLPYYEGCVDCYIEHYESYFGFLPLKKDGKLLFPIGKFRGQYNFNEIRFALEHNIIKIHKIHNVVYGPPMKSPFESYINEIYNERKLTKNNLEKLILKLLLNCLYGKFAQKIKSEMIYIDDMNKDFDLIAEYKEKKQLIRIVPFSASRNDCFIEVKSKRGYLYNTIPVFSSYITSYARVILLKFMLINITNDVLYCDTDSIFLRKKPNLPINNNLGAWKLENKLITDIRGLKNYSYISDNKKYDKIKGVPKNATKDKENRYNYESLIKTREALRRNVEAGVLEKRTKVLTNLYTKRIILNNGETLLIKL